MFQPIVMQGILYYEIYPGSTQNPQGWTAVDLRTGETLYTITTPVSATGTQMILRCGQILDYQSPNAFGARPYLWTQGTPSGVNVQSGTTTYNLHEPSTGNYILSVVNGSAMTITEDDGGNLIGFYVNSSTANAYRSPTLNCWNSTQCIIAGTSGADAWEWYPYQNSKIPFSLGLMWSMPLATNISGAALPGTLGIVSVNSGVVVLTSMGSAGGGSYTSGFQIEAGYSMTTGAQLWIVNRTQTPFTKLNGSGQNSFLLNGDGVYVVTNQNTYTETGYNVNTGAQLWQTTLTNPNTYDNYLTNGFVANGVLYLFGLGGDIYALNIHSGEILWHQTTNAILGPSGSDNPYGVWPIWTQGEAVTIADGKLYFPIGHEYAPPLFRGAHEICLNITNGEPIWNVLGFFVDSPAPIADGIMTTVNGYDNQIYAFGKGPTSLTVSSPQVGVTTSTPITITGTITDISAGSKQNAVAANFPNGLPCVSDASISAWMEFVYEQQQCPNNATGVPVTINVIDANGNYRSIGTTTSNIYGTYSLTWKPDISGDYTVIASFAGSESYYPSSASTALYASETAPPPTSPPTQPTSMADQYTLPGIIAIIVTIIIGFAVTILVLRKRP
jgi:outer membrane protein assembly factor BamB